jgi:hypothetical protein
MSLHMQIAACIRAHEDELGTFRLEVDDTRVDDQTNVVETISASMSGKLEFVKGDLDGLELEDATRADVRKLVRDHLKSIILE